jgi:hypothetical protein
MGLQLELWWDDWAAAPGVHDKDGGGSKLVWNVGKLLHGATTQMTAIFRYSLVISVK